MPAPLCSLRSSHATILRDSCLVDPGRYAWKYLSSYKDALAQQRIHCEILESARKPRRFSMSDAEWGQRKCGYRSIAARLRFCCRKQPCGSFACRVCRRAFAQAHYEAFYAAAGEMAASNRSPLWFATIIPFDLKFPAATLHRCSTEQLQAWLLTRFSEAGLWNLRFFGVLELSYEEVAFGTPYFQPHWHMIFEGSRQRSGCALHDNPDR